MADDRDVSYVKNAEEALDGLYEKYAAADDAGKFILKPAIAKAAAELLNARLALFKEGTLTTAEDFEKLMDVKNQIDKAADAQAGVLAAIKLAALLGVFA